LVLALCGFALLFFLPAVLELRRPRDKGPRRVAESTMGFNRKKVLKLGVDTIRIMSDMEFPSDVEAKESVVVEGSLVIGDRCHFYGSVKASGDVEIRSKVVIEGSLIAGGGVKLGKDARIKGSVDAKGTVHLGENSFVGLSLTSGGDVEMHRGARVFKNIFSQGNIRVIRESEE
jgi:cytoskeletal protein CcmA (bactofilin family)